MRGDVQTWSFVLLMNFSNKLNFVLRNTPERKARKRYQPMVKNTLHQDNVNLKLNHYIN